MTRTAGAIFGGVALAGLLGWSAVTATSARNLTPGSLDGAGAPASQAAPLPVLGTRLTDYPEGPGQATARTSCGACHSADISRQQRLTEKQWVATLDKMARWGAVVPADKRDELIAYLAKNFGPDNKAFAPVVARPVTN